MITSDDYQREFTGEDAADDLWWICSSQRCGRSHQSLFKLFWFGGLKNKFTATSNNSNVDEETFFGKLNAAL